MTEAEWLAERNIFEMFMFLQDRKYRRKWDLFCCLCFKRVWPLLQDQRIRDYIDGIERLAEGLAAEEEIEAAWELCEVAFEANSQHFPYNWFHQSVLEYPMEFDPFDVAKACREAVGVLAAESIRPAPNVWTDEMTKKGDEASQPEEDEQVRLVNEIFGNPFRPVTFPADWRTSTAVAIAQGMYDTRDFSAMPILADALQDAGCANDDILAHCRDEGQVHVRGCWVVDLVLVKE